MRRGRRRRSPLALLAWGTLAAIIAVGQALSSRDAEPSSPLPAFPWAPDTFPTAPRIAIAPTPPPPPPSAPAPKKPRRELPRPFAAIHAFASPLIMPRLHLPRVLTPELAELSHLLGRARPGEPVAVTLTAYCIRGSTRRGNPVRPGIIAADPRIFPLAHHVELFAGGRYIGRFLVDDTGGHVLGTRIDIWTPDCEDARRFGTRRGIATLVAAE